VALREIIPLVVQQGGVGLKPDKRQDLSEPVNLNHSLDAFQVEVARLAGAGEAWNHPEWASERFRRRI
jgi:hypothetical protein